MFGSRVGGNALVQFSWTMALVLSACGSRPEPLPISVAQDQLDAQAEAFHGAAKRGDLERVRGFLGAGLPPELGLIPAAGEGRTEVLELLVEEGAPTEKLTGSRALLAAVKGGHREAEDFLRSAGATVDGADEQGRTVLLLAARRAKVAKLRRALDEGADPELATRTGRTALMTAVRKDHERNVRLLLKRGADPNTGDRDGWTALFLAVREKNVHVARLLLRAGADPNRLSSLGWTALLLAAADGDAEMMSLVLQSGADPDLATHVAASPLVQAIKGGHFEAVKVLLAAGADRSATFQGADALGWAQHLGHRKLENLLSDDAGGRS